MFCGGVIKSEKDQDQDQKDQKVCGYFLII